MPDDLMKVTLFINRDQHELIKELAKRHRVKIGLEYDKAVAFWLKQPANYMGTKQSRILKKVSNQ